jgi:hypothetical protein
MKTRQPPQSPARRRWAPRLWPLALLPLFSGAGDFEVELKCEEAVKHVAGCCNEDLRDVKCALDCHPPALTLAASECLLALDCRDLIARRLCTIEDFEKCK